MCLIIKCIPIIFAAVDAPTIIDKFGAINAILLSTYSNIFDLQLFNSTAISQASQIASFSSSVNSWLYTRIYLKKLKTLYDYSI